MIATRVTPILNVSSFAESVLWFERLGWEKRWDWGNPPKFGGVYCGDCEIFLCENAQGGRGRSSFNTTFGSQEEQSADKGVWMTIWVDDVESVYQHCQQQTIEVTWPPTDMPWNVREMHVRHPDGHVFRITQRNEA